MATTSVEFGKYGFWVEERVLAIGLILIYENSNLDEESIKLNQKIRDFKDIALNISWGGGIFILSEIIQDKNENILQLQLKLRDTMKSVNDATNKSFESVIDKYFDWPLEDLNIPVLKFSVLRVLLFIDLLLGNKLNIDISTNISEYFSPI